MRRLVVRREVWSGRVARPTAVGALQGVSLGDTGVRYKKLADYEKRLL